MRRVTAGQKVDMLFENIKIFRKLKLFKNNLNKKCAPKLSIRIKKIQIILDIEIQIFALFDELSAIEFTNYSGFLRVY